MFSTPQLPTPAQATSDESVPLKPPTGETARTMHDHFAAFRRQIIGIDQTIDTPYGKNIPLVYADWTASGRNYRCIEERLQYEVMPWMANTHTETTSTGTTMTYGYQRARQLIKQHVNAGDDDILLPVGSGATGAINKLQRMMGLKLHPAFRPGKAARTRPVVFVTHMEHHSNHTSWLETEADVVVIRPTPRGEVDLNHLEDLLRQYHDRPQKIAAVTAASNVTGIQTPYYQIARTMHRAQGYCFVDFAAAAPYVAINMHRSAEEYLDAIYFSPHKFLGGPGSSGMLIFNSALYRNPIPDHPGGGTVHWTNPWGGRRYVEDIEEREDGGTPAILQTIRAALSVQLKEEMGVSYMQQREAEQMAIVWPRLTRIKNLHVLAAEQTDRLGIISVYIDGLSIAAGVRMLNDRFGIQTRGGCSCAGTYGHYLLGIGPSHSKQITDAIDRGQYAAKPGWIRLSLHPTMTDREVAFITDCLEELAVQHSRWIKDYRVHPETGSVGHRSDQVRTTVQPRVNTWFTNSLV